MDKSSWEEFKERKKKSREIEEITIQLLIDKK